MNKSTLAANKSAQTAGLRLRPLSFLHNFTSAILLLLFVTTSTHSLPAQTSSAVQPLVISPRVAEPGPKQEAVITFENGVLTISSQGASLGYLLRKIAAETGAEMEMPSEAEEPVFAQLGPAPARAVIDTLLTGSAFNYILLGSHDNALALTRIVLFPRPPAEQKQQLALAARTEPQTQPRAEQAYVADAAPQPQAAPETLSTPVGQQQYFQQQRTSVLEDFRRSQASH